MLDKRSVFTPDIQSAETKKKTRRVQNYAMTQNLGVNFGVASTLQNLAKFHRGVHCAGAVWARHAMCESALILQRKTCHYPLKRMAAEL